jgi:hypothetical protein
VTGSFEFARDEWIDLAIASIMAFDRAKELVGKTVTFW